MSLVEKSSYSKLSSWIVRREIGCGISQFIGLREDKDARKVVKEQQSRYGGAMSLHYTIKVSKDHAQVMAEWDITLDMSDEELISNFTLNVEGKPLDTQCSGGNKACKSASWTLLSNPSADCPVTFVITTNKPDMRDGSDVLRGEKTYDDVDFSD